MVGQLRTRATRILIIFLNISLYVVLIVLDSLYSIPGAAAHPATEWLTWLRFGFSVFVAFTFLSVGSFVWLFARDRAVAWLLFLFSTTVMLSFATETASVLNVHFFSGISSAGSSLAFTFFAILLLLFPRNLLAQPPFVDGEVVAVRRKWQSYLLKCLRVYIVLLAALCVLSMLDIIVLEWFSLSSPSWLTLGDAAYHLFVMGGILLTIVISYSRNTTLRERQQQRIFVVGVVLAIVPLLLLTVFPSFLNAPRFYVDPQLSTLTVILLPLALGYTILRYQVLVFDRYIRSAVAWMTGIIGLFGVGYLVVMVSNLLLPGGRIKPVIVAVTAVGILGPCVWWLARVVTERLFFHEMRHYRHLIDRADMMSGEGFDIDEAAQLLVTASLQVFKTQEICLYVLDDDTGTYRLYPSLQAEQREDADRWAVVKRVNMVVTNILSANQGASWINVHDPLIDRVASASRPIMLHEVTRTEPVRLLSLGRYIVSSEPLDHTDPLLAPVWANGKLIGLLVLGERSDHQQYAGPDLDAAQYLLARFASVLETARLYAKSRRNAGILSTLYGGNTLSIQSFATVEDVARAYTRVAAEAVKAGAEIWLYAPQSHGLSRVAHEGNGPLLSEQSSIIPSSERDWAPYFIEADYVLSSERSAAEEPPCLPQAPRFPFAWLPLFEGQEPRGVLVLTYPRPHLFAQEERHVLEMFARQCAVAIENSRITLALRAAYERLKELDQLKDEFIMTASHELRTPLTAVQGYIELLADFGQSLDAESQAEFLAKARRGCDELTLMVNNIMDASVIETEAEQLKRSPVSVAAAVQSVLEMLEGNFAREQRSVEVSIPSELTVFADPVRLRQVVMNLLNNALKFSDPGAGIEIFGFTGHEQVTIAIRDYGLGVPPEAQGHLFERFVRLERDMNSPVRGTGLGLYICKQLVEAMQGRIWMESSGVPGEGSMFAFSLKPGRLAREEASPLVERQRV